MKRKKVALYDPYLDSLGGGENHSLSICKALEDVNYTVDVFWDENYQTRIADQFNLHFRTLQFKPNIFKNKTGDFTKLRQLHQYDIFIYVTDGSYFFSSAKHNYVFAMVPQKDLFYMSPLNLLKLHNYRFVTNSKFTHNQLRDWGIKSDVIYPYLADEHINADISQPREKIILNVGRFFRTLHAKRQDIAIKTFLELRTRIDSLREYKLVLAGGVNDRDQDYMKELRELAGGDPHIQFEPNIGYSDLMNLYAKAEMYWHFAGYGINAKEHPEQVEHLGITPLEAMARGCLTFCYRAGGPEETIQDGQTGWLFRNEQELQDKLNHILSKTDEQVRVRYHAKQFIREHFSYTVFADRVKQVLIPNQP